MRATSHFVCRFDVRTRRNMHLKGDFFRLEHLTTWRLDDLTMRCNDVSSFDLYMRNQKVKHILALKVWPECGWHRRQRNTATCEQEKWAHLVWRKIECNPPKTYVFVVNATLFFQFILIFFLINSILPPVAFVLAELKQLNFNSFARRTCVSMRYYCEYWCYSSIRVCIHQKKEAIRPSSRENKTRRQTTTTTLPLSLPTTTTTLCYYYSIVHEFRLFLVLTWKTNRCRYGGGSDAVALRYRSKSRGEFLFSFNFIFNSVNSILFVSFLFYFFIFFSLDVALLLSVLTLHIE